MARLATIEDVEARMGRTVIDQSERERILTLLDDASAAIRLFTGRTFETGTSSFVTHVRRGEAMLPGSISDVITVEAMDGTALDAVWDGGRRLTIGGVDQFDADSLGGDFVVRVTVNEVPAGTSARQVVRAVAAQMAARAYGRPADETAVTQESIAGYSYSVGAAAAAGGIGMLPGEREALTRLMRPNVGTVWMSGGLR